MKKLTKLLALALAVVMLLPVNALAAGNEAGGPRLVWNWLDWNEEGAYASDDTLSGRNYGDEEMHMAAGDDYPVIFFTIGEDGKRTPVIPKAGKGVTIEKLEKDEIASGAKQSNYYVRVRLDGWADSELTSGKAAMKVVAELPDVGFYTTAEATQKGFLRNDQQPCDLSQLPDKTAYFIVTATDEVNGRHATGVKKSTNNGTPSLYDVEKVSDSVYKIVMKAEDGGVGVNLVLSWLDTNGSAYDDEPGYWFEYPAAPELWIRWADQDWEQGGCWFISEEAEPYQGFAPWPCSGNITLVFYTCDYDENGNQTFTPVPADKLKATGGLILTPTKEDAVPGSPEKGCFVDVRATEWEKDFTISYNGYEMYVSSYLPDIGMYVKPELTTESFRQPGYLSPLIDTWYLGSAATFERNGREMKSLELLPANEGNSNHLVTLKKLDNGFYALAFKDKPDSTWLNLQLAVTWVDGDGNTWTEDAWFDLWNTSTVLVSENSSLGVGTEEPGRYADVKDKVATTLTLQAGEEKTIYLANSYYHMRTGDWVVGNPYPAAYYTTGGLKLTPVNGKDRSRYTISCDTPGEYQIGISGYAWYIYDTDGKEISDKLQMEQHIEPNYDYETGKWTLVQYDEEWVNYTPYEFDGTFEIKPNGEPTNFFPFPVTVKVTGEAAKPAFPDVASTAWYAPAVTFANSNGYMNGNADGTFNPEGKITGAEFAQILYNKEGKPAAADGAAFNGVTSQWYAPAILWAAGKGIVTDAGDAAVAPEANLTRQQIALMLYNYMGKPEAKGDLTAFTDAANVSAWAKDAMEWAVGAGVLKGSDNALNPTATATRAETAQILMNFFG